MFIEPESVPAYLPPISMQEAHEQAVIGTADFFPPVVDDAYSYGAIARSRPVSMQRVRETIYTQVFYQKDMQDLVLKYVPERADVAVGDVVVTSGLDGTYPPGLAVARVASSSGDSRSTSSAICRSKSCCGLNSNGMSGASKNARQEPSSMP